MGAADPAGVRFQRLVVGGVSAALLIGCILAGRPVNGVVAAVGLWFGAGWVIGGVVKAKRSAAASGTVDGVADADTPIEPELVPVLARLEAVRVATAGLIERRLRTRLPVGLGAGAGIWLFSQFGRHPDDPAFLAVYAAFGASAGWVWAAGTLSSAYSRRYKDEVLCALAGKLGALSYRAAVAPDRALLREQRLFAPFDRVRADDEIYGTYHGVPVSIVELTLSDERGKSTRTVFDGLFVRIALPRTLNGTTAVVADIGVLTTLRDAMSARGGARARVDDADFERAYQVYTTDQVSARALLTPAFMERFLRLGTRTGFRQPLALAQGNDLTVVLPKGAGGDLFAAPSYDRPADSRDVLARLHADLLAVLAVADAVIDLDGSTRGRL